MTLQSSCKPNAMELAPIAEAPPSFAASSYLDAKICIFSPETFNRKGGMLDNLADSCTELAENA